MLHLITLNSKVSKHKMPLRHQSLITCQIQILIMNFHLRLLLMITITITIMMIITVTVVETFITMENPIELLKNHEDNLATTQGEIMRDHLVIHNIIMYFKANHQVQFLQEEQFGVEIILLN